MNTGDEMTGEKWPVIKWKRTKHSATIIAIWNIHEVDVVEEAIVLVNNSAVVTVGGINKEKRNMTKLQKVSAFLALRPARQ
jgi:hypothetical protein